ncbi:AAA family ATPase [Flavobacterium covae]|uniref:ATPase dynein-related AAA domain-containing protein n=1 Tax=Flavobacterium columnare TaxID=996 RepID=A0AA94EZT7_9FLAO|nr:MULTISPECIES: AAA family ATPase [Flavobacterium]MCH4830353.1 AAA family ATPase [Flavobacterium columnare]MCH4833711.1 AAA family ATPase [Flavobacterium columnare]MCJ1806904.1 AAA family ATPase [Flavobacterium covae]
MISNELISYLKKINEESKFTAILSERGGYITFSNSGQRGSVKYFTLGLDSIITTIKDIFENHNIFISHTNYVEGEWRDLGSTYLNDETANALSTVQTKPLFTTISKLINWANKEKSTPYSDNIIDLDKDSLTKTILQLEELANLYSPKQLSSSKTKISEIKTIVSEKDLKQFAFKTFKVFLDKYGYKKILKNVTEKDSHINEIEYIGIKIKPYFGTGNLIGVFESEQNKETLSSSNTQRFFDENLNITEFPYSYFTTQWADVEGGTLSFNNLQKFVNDLSNGDFEANKNGDKYSLNQKTTVNKYTLQKIYFGAPGTGKSYKIDQEIQNLHPKFYERVTFHPEYDHTNFVGGYRPKSKKNEKGEDIITYQFVPQAFTNIYERAWNDTENQYYLIIEEINRGNCAEIFGDIFQLLDRNSNYTVSPSTELKEHLEKVLTNQDGINKGLRLPSNLTIYATMNTSDQSLFPMDSAFKRRWDWEYIPICYDDIPENESFGYIVIIDDNIAFKWIDFLYNVNTIIKTNANLGMDKCLGNYFIKSETKEISLNDFINKAIFYLWNDVFKDEDNADSIFEKGTSYEDFFPINSNGKNLVLRIIEKLNITIENK